MDDISFKYYDQIQNYTIYVHSTPTSYYLDFR